MSHKATTWAIQQREPDRQPRVLPVAVALVHLHLGQAGAAARAPDHRPVNRRRPR